MAPGGQIQKPLRGKYQLDLLNACLRDQKDGDTGGESGKVVRQTSCGKFSFKEIPLR